MACGMPGHVERGDPRAAEIPARAVFIGLGIGPCDPVEVALDALAAAGGSYARAARALGVTTSQLMRFLRSDREVWRAVEELRA